MQHYLGGKPGVRGIASRAYVEAGYSPKSARSGASALLREPRVEAAIAAYLADKDVTVKRVLEELRRVAFSDLRDFATWGPDGVTLRACDELEDGAAACVAEVIEHRRVRRQRQPDGSVPAEIEDRRVRIKLHDKMQALVNISKYLGILKEHTSEPAPIFPKGFFAALVMGDVNQIKGFLEPEAAAQLDAMKRVGPGPVTKPEPASVKIEGMKRLSRVSEPMSQASEAAEPAPETPA